MYPVALLSCCYSCFSHHTIFKGIIAYIFAILVVDLLACRMLVMLHDVCFVAGHFLSKETALCEQGINEYHRLEFHFH